MNVKHLIQALHQPKIIGTLPDKISGLTADSRKVVKGGAFIAVKGLNHDGHDFIEQVASAGVSLIFAEKALQTDVQYVLVDDTRSAWGILMQAWYGNPQNDMKIAGITGTNGKTTVSTLVHQAMQHLGATAGLMGTISTKIGDSELQSSLTTGDPEQIANHFAAMQQAGCTYVAMEVSSHALDQKRVSGLSFDVAVCTNISHDHLDYHGNMENYIQAKKRLFDDLSENAVAIINTDDAALKVLISDCKADIWGFGFDDESLRILEESASGMVIEVDEVQIQTPLSGRFNASNVAAAYLVCRAFGCSANNAANALSAANGARGRMERVSTGKMEPAIFVDYAHTPDALKNVLETLAALKSTGKLIVVFGCGGDRDRAKRPEMGKLASILADMIVITSDNPRSEVPEVIIKDIVAGISKDSATDRLEITDRKAAIVQAIKSANKNDIVLIAGKGHETYQEIQGVRYPLDDTQIARQALEMWHESTLINKETH